MKHFFFYDLLHRNFWNEMQLIVSCWLFYRKLSVFESKASKVKHLKDKR